MSRVSLLLLLAPVAGCCASVETIDPRIYFSRETPLGTTLSFSWSVQSLQWEHVADCIRDAGQVEKVLCQQIARYEVLTDRKRATVESAGDGGGVVLQVPFRSGERPGNGRDVFTVYLVPERKIEDVELWVIDLARTVEANSPVAVEEA
jgi:hypothetical protein